MSDQILASLGIATGLVDSPTADEGAKVARYRVNVALPDVPQTFPVIDTDTGETVATYKTFGRALARAAALNRSTN